MSSPTRGTDPHDEVDAARTIRDLRGPMRKMGDFLREPNNAFAVVLSSIGIALFFPGLTLLSLLVAFVAFRLGRPAAVTLPISCPVQADVQDANNKNPQSKRPKRGEGIFFLGNYRAGIIPGARFGRDEELWITNSDLRQHHVMFGTTGAGKTEALLGFLYNSMTWGSGLLFSDGKGTIEFAYKAYATMREFGREDDYLLLNLMTGNADLTAKTPERISNSLNVLAQGSAPFLNEVIGGLIPESGGDNAMWRDRAMAMTQACLWPLTYDRDHKHAICNPGTLRDLLAFPRIYAQAQRKDIPEVGRAALRTYLESLAGYNEQAGVNQGAKTLEQHGFLVMQFTKMLSTLTDVYGHIFNRMVPDIDLPDVVLNSRVLIVLLPSLEKSGPETRALGGLIMALVKAMMAGTLGFRIEGTFAENVDNLPTKAPYPYPVIYDEVGMYMPKDGTAIQNAQARGLGFCIVAAAQDRDQMDRADAHETEAILGSARFKHALALESEPTAKVFIQQAGEAYVPVARGKRLEGEFGTWRDQGEVSFESRSRLTISDVRRLRPGEAFTLYRDAVLPVQMFYPAVRAEGIDNLTLNQFLEVLPPSPQDLVQTTEAFKRARADFMRAVRDLAPRTPQADSRALAHAAGIERLARLMRAAARLPFGPVEQAIVAFEQALRPSVPPAAAHGMPEQATADSLPVQSEAHLHPATTPTADPAPMAFDQVSAAPPPPTPPSVLISAIDDPVVAALMGLSAPHVEVDLPAPPEAKHQPPGDITDSGSLEMRTLSAVEVEQQVVRDLAALAEASGAVGAVDAQILGAATLAELQRAGDYPPADLAVDPPDIDAVLAQFEAMEREVASRTGTTTEDAT